MIEGLIATISGVELQALCKARAEHHRERQGVYCLELARMKEAQIAGMAYTGGDPQRAIAERMELHAQEADEMEFLAAHVVEAETYRLDRDDLKKLGICRRGY